MSPEDLPPGPRRPALAQTLQWVFDPERFMRTCRERYGSTFTARLGPSADVIFLCEPEDIKTVFHGTPEETNMGDINGLFRRVLGTNSLLVIDGEEHLRQRRLLLPPFHGERIAEHYGAMVEAAEEDVAGWQEGQTLTLQPHMQAMTLNVILAAVFGLGPGERRDRFRVLLARLLELNTTLATTLPQLRIELGGRSPWGKLMRCTAEVDELLYDEITRRRAERDRTSGDVLSLLLDAQDADDGQAMTDRELRDQLLTMLVAGHETTATALAWAFERLLRNPAALVHVTAELAQGSTTYLDATIKEVLRLRPVVPITARKVTVPFTVGGPHVRAGHGADAVHLPAAPAPRHLRAAGGVPPRAVHRAQPAAVQLDPVRRRGKALPGIGVRPGRDAGGHADRPDARSAGAGARGARARGQARVHDLTARGRAGGRAAAAGLGAPRQAAQRAAGTGDGRGQHQVQ